MACHEERVHLGANATKFFDDRRFVILELPSDLFVDRAVQRVLFWIVAEIELRLDALEVLVHIILRIVGANFVDEGVRVRH